MRAVAVLIAFPLRLGLAAGPRLVEPGNGRGGRGCVLGYRRLGRGFCLLLGPITALTPAAALLVLACFGLVSAGGLAGPGNGLTRELFNRRDRFLVDRR